VPVKSVQFPHVPFQMLPSTVFLCANCQPHLCLAKIRWLGNLLRPGGYMLPHNVRQSFRLVTSFLTMGVVVDTHLDHAW
jgi:hypothetical protein